MYHQLTREQRYAIYLGIQEGKTRLAIARQIGVHPSTVGREIQRNATPRGHYSWRIAQENAQMRQERLPGNRRIDPQVLKEALRLLCKEDWSPRQIAGHLALQGKAISHETLYKHIREDESGGLRKHCRHRMKYRRHKKRAKKAQVRYLPGRVSIHERPREADGHRFGDWEMDLIIGKGQKSAILTLCERSVNFLLLARLPRGKNPEGVADKVVELLFPYRKQVHTITTDNGSEFACHQRIAQALGTTVYFADAYASWQKGAIENMNKLVRQYLPKGLDFSDVSDDFIKQVQYKINRRPRERLGFSTPKKEFFKFFL